MELNRSPVADLGVFADNNLFIKRDDLIPYSFGGNKARKAIGFFEEIEARNCDCVVTYGSSSSNHCRVVSNMAVRKGLECRIISPKEASDPTFNSKMIELFGAKVVMVPVERVHETIDRTIDKLQEEGRKPYFIPGGGHGNIGTEAYMKCYEEIREFEAERRIHFDYIFMPSGTGTTQAGLICGQLIHEDLRTIVGISIARKKPRGRNIVMESVKNYLIQRGGLNPSDELIQRKTLFVDDYVGAGYGKYDSAILDTIKEAMIRYGIPLDSTYTGKAFHGMKQYLSKKEITGKNVLFIHTGGTPLFFDDLERM